MTSRRGLMDPEAPGSRVESEDRGLEMQKSSVPGGFTQECRKERGDPFSSIPVARTNPDELLGYRVRIRSGQLGQEGVRIVVQYVLVLAVVFLCLCAALAPAAGTSPLHVPGTVFEATFGPSEKLWRLEPPLMDRARYEDPSNFWKPVMFSPESALGWLQDRAYALWNWGVRCIWQGPLHKKAVAVLATLAIWVPICGFVLQYHRRIIRWTPWYVKGSYLKWMPEGLLVLEQLILARELFDRRLSQEAEIETLNPGHP